MGQDWNKSYGQIWINLKLKRKAWINFGLNLPNLNMTQDS